MESFQRAMEIGVDVLETDVHMTLDGHIVVSHDGHGRRMAGVDEAIVSSTLAQVKSWDAGWGFVASDGTRPFSGQGIVVPALEELLRAFPQARLNVDIKQRRPPMVATLLDLLSRHRSVRVTLASFFEPVMREVRARGWRGSMVLSRNQVLALWLASRARYDARPRSGDTVQVPPRSGPFDLSTPSFIERCHALGLRVDYWTINDPAEVEDLLARGADGIISDHPARLLSVFARHRVVTAS